MLDAAMRALLPSAIVLALASSSLACSSQATKSPADSPEPLEHGEAAWAELSSALPGRWVAEIEGGAIEVEYRLTARDSVILETWMPGTPAETITTYHCDGGRLVLTHYCGQGNQPHLALTAFADGALRFEQLRVSDRDPSEGALEHLELTLGRGELVRRETYERDGARDESTLRFVRQPKAD